ncbi:hypothetical protein [Metabacillus halosaccharovorans]|nr:hypothetical protein [Metabacillus halosaccharovorans]
MKPLSQVYLAYQAVTGLENTNKMIINVNEFVLVEQQGYRINVNVDYLLV